MRCFMKRILIFTVLLAFLLGGCSTVTVPETTAAETENSVQAPDFTVYDVQGQAWRLSDFRGKPIVLNFWATWCGPCKKEMPDFNEKYLELGDKVQFLMVNVTDGVRDTVENASALMAEKGYQFPVFYDTQLEASNLYGVNALPSTFFIDKEGNVVLWGEGMLTAENLQYGLDQIVTEKQG